MLPALVFGWEGGHTPSTLLFFLATDRTRLCWYATRINHARLLDQAIVGRRPFARGFRWSLAPSRCATTPRSNPWTRPSDSSRGHPVGAAVAVDAAEITPRQCCWFSMASDHHRHRHRHRRKPSRSPWPQQGVAGTRTAYRSPTSPHVDCHRHSRWHWPESQHLESRDRPTALFCPGEAGCPCSPSFPFPRAMMMPLLLCLAVCRWKHVPSRCGPACCYGFSRSPLPPPDPGLVLMVGGRDVDDPIRGRQPARVVATWSHHCLLWAYLEPNVSRKKNPSEKSCPRTGGFFFFVL